MVSRKLCTDINIVRLLIEKLLVEKQQSFKSLKRVLSYYGIKGEKIIHKINAGNLSAIDLLQVLLIVNNRSIPIEKLKKEIIKKDEM